MSHVFILHVLSLETGNHSFFIAFFSERILHKGNTCGQEVIIFHSNLFKVHLRFTTAVH